MQNLKFVKSLVTGLSLSVLLYSSAFADCQEGYVKNQWDECVATSGECGSGCTWQIDGNGTVTVNSENGYFNMEELIYSGLPITNLVLPDNITEVDSINGNSATISKDGITRCWHGTHTG